MIKNLRKAFLLAASLIRVNMAPLTMSVPIIGAWGEERQFGLAESIGLILIGFFAHSFGFALNDVMDRKIDAFTPSRQTSPLVTGQISIRAAIAFIIFQIAAALLACLLIFDGHPLPFKIINISILLSVFYNLFSKRGKFLSVFAELSLAASIGGLCLFGAATQSLWPSLNSSFLALTLALIVLLLNSTPNHLKDIFTDYYSGHSNFVIAAGARVARDGKIFIPKILRGYALGLQFAIGLCIIVIALLFRAGVWRLALSVFFTILSAFHLHNVLSQTSFDMIRQSYPLLNGYYNYLALSLVVVPWYGGIGWLVYGVIIAGFILFPAFLVWKIMRNPYRLILVEKSESDKDDKD